MENKFIVGIDVSKLVLDAVLIITDERNNIHHIQVSNETKGLSELLKWLKKFKDFDLNSTLFCMEHTGIYNYPLLTFLSHHECRIWLENPVQIKKSLGIQRGKNDKIDAK